MRTSVEVDDDLIAMAPAELATKTAAVEEALRRLVRQHQQGAAVADMSGLGWNGDLAAARERRCADDRL